MDKLSLYEILSFVIPGFIVIKLVDIFRFRLLGSNNLFSSDNIGDSLILFCASLVLGVIIHVLTTQVILKMPFLKKLVYTSVKDVELGEYSKLIIPYLNGEYTKLKKHDCNENTSNQPTDYLFDFAYYYLEVNDKITQVKNFQSLYFMFRNFFTIGLILVPILLFTIFYSYYNELNQTQNLGLSLLIVFIGLLVNIYVTRWLRIKMIERVFESYYADRTHNNTNT